MVTIDRKTHWERVYSTKGETGVSWYQTEPRLSLELITSVAPARGGRIIDVGGGASASCDTSTSSTADTGRSRKRRAPSSTSSNPIPSARGPPRAHKPGLCLPSRLSPRARLSGDSTRFMIRAASPSSRRFGLAGAG